MRVPHYFVLAALTLILFNSSPMLRAAPTESDAQKLDACIQKNAALEQQNKDLALKSFDHLKFKLITTSRRSTYFSESDRAEAGASCKTELTNKCIELADGRTGPEILGFDCMKTGDTSGFFEAERLVCSAICTYSKN